jgi:3'-phosphoadenosine 5'-phosphosulfate sulfotransferase (PAPS reductase)/FAD synthetase
MPTTYAAFSGGKDSTAMVLRMAELGEDFSCLFTPTGNELPALEIHLRDVITRIARPLVLPPNQGLAYWIDFYQALPNFRMRWCTRQIKIRPCIDFLTQHPGSTLAVGLRADEETRVGLYGDYAHYRYPLQEWGWELDDVREYLGDHGVVVPDRTDCALCFGQRLGEWYRLWRDHPDEFEKGVQLETRFGHTFRSAQRDSWPAALIDLRTEFESGRVPRGVGDVRQACLVCKL